MRRGQGPPRSFPEAGLVASAFMVGARPGSADLGPVLRGIRATGSRGYAPPVSSYASDVLHLIRVARPQGYPSRITTAEHLRAAPLGAAHRATRAIPRHHRAWEPSGSACPALPMAERVGPWRCPYPARSLGPESVDALYSAVVMRSADPLPLRPTKRTSVPPTDRPGANLRSSPDAGTGSESAS